MIVQMGQALYTFYIELIVGEQINNEKSFKKKIFFFNQLNNYFFK